MATTYLWFWPLVFSSINDVTAIQSKTIIKNFRLFASYGPSQLLMHFTPNLFFFIIFFWTKTIYFSRRRRGGPSYSFFKTNMLFFQRGEAASPANLAVLCCTCVPLYLGSGKQHHKFIVNRVITTWKLPARQWRT